MRLVSVDVGKRSVAWAALENRELQACGFEEAPTLPQLAEAIENRFRNLRRDNFEAVIELPQIYDRRHWKGDPNDCIDVAVTAGMVAQAMDGRAEFVKPHDWKGSRSKKVDHPVTLRLLNETESHILQDVKILQSKKHNVIDAVGIGLWKVGRR